MRRFIEVISAAIFASLLSPVARADVAVEQVTTSAWSFLTIPVDPRSMAMAQTGAADFTPRAQAYNPAALAFAQGLAYTQGSVDWPANVELMDIGLHGGRSFARGGTRFRLGGAVGYKELALHAPVPNIFLPAGTGRSFDSKDWHMSLVGAAALESDHGMIALGGSAKPIESKIAGNTVSAWGFDVGVLAAWRFEHDSGARIAVTGGASAMNLGSRVNFSTTGFDLPRQIRAGVGIRVNTAPQHFLGRVSSAASIVTLVEHIDQTFGRDDLLAAGLETGIFDTVYFRMGVVDNLDRPVSNTNTWGLGLAWSYRHVRLSADYSTYELSTQFGDVEAWGGGLSYSF